MNQPLVTVNILSYNRINKLRVTLRKVFEQEYKNIEVIVVDNNSTDGTQDMVRKEFPGVVLICLPRNIGIAGWNEGFKETKGEYILVLDDDCYPNNNSITMIVKEFLCNSEIGAVSVNVYNYYENDNIKVRFPGACMPGEDIEYLDNWIMIIGCSFAIRKCIYDGLLFPLNYFICFHELPVVLKIFEKGFKIAYNKKITSIHLQNNINQTFSSFKEVHHYRNMLNFVYYYFPEKYNLYYSFKIALFYFTRSIKRGWFRNYNKFTFEAFNNELSQYNTKRLNTNEMKLFLRDDLITHKLLSKLKYLTLE